MSLETLMPVSEDSRRSLSEFGKWQTWKCVKHLVINSDCEIGGHYHKLKDECFLLVSGEIEELRLNDIIKTNLKAGTVINVFRGVKHTFKIKKDSVLICLASELFNKEDDYVF